jgi:serine-type D-Ala-D-Ala carboxypeptidase/endopeptidase
MKWFVTVILMACSAPAHPVGTPRVDGDPDGPHRAQVAAQVEPLVDRALVSGVVVGLYDAGKLEIYGFGAGPGGKPPTGSTLFEIGSLTKIYTSLLLADAVQRREVELDAPVATLLPPGITVPIRDNQPITLRHLAVHSSGLPRLPPSLATGSPAPDPYAKYDEDALVRDLLRTQLDSTPGTQITYSNYGAGLLGFALGRRIGGGFAQALATRVLIPLELRDTFTTVPATAAARRAAGTTDDLAPAVPWTFDALAGAGALVSTARDQLRLIEAELDAAAGSRLPLRAPMKLTQEAQLDHVGDNVGLGWVIDSAGRYSHNGGTGGFHSFLSFDPKTKRGVVILTSTSTSLVERLSELMYKILEGTVVDPPRLASAAQLAAFTGSYDLGGTKLAVAVHDDRLYLEGPDEPRHRLAPISEHDFWIEALQSIARFQREGDKVVRVVFSVGDHQLVAPRVPSP